MIKRLAELNLVSYQPYQGIELTPHGSRIALEVLRHHRLIELYLVEALGMSWDKVHHEAERLEHVMSKELIERIDLYLGHPSFDPHGHPIPDSEGNIAKVSAVRLADLNAGQSAVVSEVIDRDPKMLRYLAELGIFPKASVRILDIAPFEGPITILIGEEEKSIGFELARSIFVKNVVVEYERIMD
jgi:DtxR family Mn-dependent transcriptional regulator